MSIFKDIISIAAPIVGGIFGGPVGASIGGAIGSLAGGSSSADASKKASQQALDFQQKGLDYQIGVNEKPLAQRDEAIDKYGGFFGLNGGNQNNIINEAKNSPFYSSLIDQGQQGVASAFSATGGLRTGNANEAFKNSNQNVLMQLVNQQLGGLQRISETPINTGGVANSYTNMGSTQADGTVAAANANQVGIGGALKALTPLITDWANGSSSGSSSGNYTAPLSQYREWAGI